MTAGSDYTLITFASSSGTTASNLSLGDTPGGFSGTLNLNADSVTLHVNAVPEPSTVLFGAVNLVALVFFLNRKTA